MTIIGSFSINQFSVEQVGESEWELQESGRPVERGTSFQLLCERAVAMALEPMKEAWAAIVVLEERVG